MTEPWITLVYFVAGAAGTFARVWLAPAMEDGINKHAIVEVFSGGVAGIVLPWIATFSAGLVGIDQAAIGTMPIMVKAGIVFLLAASGSLVAGELLARFRARTVRGMAAAPPAAPPPPGPAPPPGPKAP
jgi:hypothetical protein